MIRKLKNKLMSCAMVFPTIVWLLLFLLIPLLYVIFISFMSKNSYGGVEYIFSLNAYSSVINSVYLRIFFVSFKLALETTIICLLVAYPFAYIMANAPAGQKKIYVLLIMLPFWINSMIRIYGWNTILRKQGILNTLLVSIGIIDSPLELLYTDGAVLLGMVYDLLPFMILPLYSSIEKLDPALLEAGEDLGANRVHSFTRIILPLTMPGIFAGVVQTFIPALGLFYISDMLGGAKTMYLGNLIKNQFMSARNWPLGAALSIVLIVFTLFIMKLYSKVGSIDDMV